MSTTAPTSDARIRAPEHGRSGSFACKSRISALTWEEGQGLRNMRKRTAQNKSHPSRARFRLRGETLEPRRLLAFDPSGMEQAYVESLNRMHGLSAVQRALSTVVIRIKYVGAIILQQSRENTVRVSASCENLTTCAQVL